MLFSLDGDHPAHGSRRIASLLPSGRLARANTAAGRVRITKRRSRSDALIAAVWPDARGGWDCPSLFLWGHRRCLAVLLRFFFGLLGQRPLFPYSLPSDRLLTGIAYRGGPLHRLSAEHTTVRFSCHTHYPRFPCGRGASTASKILGPALSKVPVLILQGGSLKRNTEERRDRLPGKRLVDRMLDNDWAAGYHQ